MRVQSRMRLTRSRFRVAAAAQSRHLCGKAFLLEDLGLDVSDGEFVAFAEALMEDYDADGNGELDFEEFKKLYAQCLESDETRKAYAEELRAAVGGLVGGALSAVVESDAAAKIQAVHRGKQARKERQEKREQEAAAVNATLRAG